MKNLKSKAWDLGAIEILTREQLKNVVGASADSGTGGGRCKSDVKCSMYQVGDGGCLTVGTQCRCVRYENGAAVESVPDSFCVKPVTPPPAQP